MVLRRRLRTSRHLTDAGAKDPKRMKIRKLDHYNLWSFKRDETLTFYCEVLGLEDGAHLRPPSSSPGTWLLVDGHPAVHINFTEDTGNTGTGTIDHIAFDASNASEFENSFTKHGITFKKVDRPEIGLTQLFVTDPNGVKIELNIRA